MFVENDYILAAKLSKLFEISISLTNLQVIRFWFIECDTINVQDEATVLGVTNTQYAELIGIKLQSKDSELHGEVES